MSGEVGIVSSPHAVTVSAGASGVFLHIERDAVYTAGPYDSITLERTDDGELFITATIGKKKATT
jgi:hypothetical protein